MASVTRGMFLGEIRIRTTKRLTVTFPRFAQMAQIGARAFTLIRERIQRQQVDADGRPLPPLSQGKRGSTIAVPVDDPLVEATPKADRWLYANPGSDGKPVVARLKVPGYGALKERRGGRPVRDATLGGDLWRNGQVTATTLRGADVVRLTFRGADKAQVVKRVGERNGQPVFAVTTSKIYNRDKARLLQFRRRNKAGQADEGSFAFALMALSRAELEALVVQALSQVRIFG